MLEYNRPLSASRDLNLHGWAGRIPETGFPLLLANSINWCDVPLPFAATSLLLLTFLDLLLSFHVLLIITPFLDLATPLFIAVFRFSSHKAAYMTFFYIGGTISFFNQVTKGCWCHRRRCYRRCYHQARTHHTYRHPIL